MGMKTIEQQYSKDVADYRKTTFRFIDEARRVNAELAEYKKKEDAIMKLHQELLMRRVELAEEVHRIDTQGVMQFAEVKKLLILAAEHAQPHAINMAEIDSIAASLESQMKLEMERKMKEYFDKLASSWPAELKPGMTFSRKTGDIVELIAPPQQLRGRTGDEAILLKVRYVKGYIMSAGDQRTMNRAELSVKNGWRFLKT
jgi:hypothetical protein